MRKRHDTPKGSLHSLTVASPLLAANLLAEPPQR